MNSREKILVTWAGIAVIAYALIVFVATPIYQKQKRMDGQIESKIQFISKYQEVLNQKAYYEKKKKMNRALKSELNRQFFSQQKPSLAAASLQKILEVQAQNSGVSIISAKIKKPKFTEGLLTVPVEITVRSPLENLSRMLNQVENHQRLLVIDDISARRINKTEPEFLEARLVINGFIQQLEPEDIKKT